MMVNLSKNAKLTGGKLSKSRAQKSKKEKTGLRKKEKQVLDNLVATSLSNMDEQLHLADRACQHKIRESGVGFGGMASNMLLLTYYDEYKRRGDAILVCIKRLLEEGRIKRKRKLSEALKEEYRRYLKSAKKGIDTGVHKLGADVGHTKKPTLNDIEKEILDRANSEIELATLGIINSQPIWFKRWASIVWGKLPIPFFKSSN